MKIAIVGAGPAGGTAALELAKQGRHEVVLLDRSVFPRAKTCGSGLGPRCLEVLKELGLFEDLAKLSHKITGLRFVGPGGQEALLDSGFEAAWILPRETFDAKLAFSAEQHGAKFEQGFFVKRLVRDPFGKVVGVSDGTRTIEADLTILADGAHSRFSVDRRPRKQIAAIMAWYEGVPFRKGILEMYYDRRVRPFYGWMFPETDTRVNVGICYPQEETRDPKVLLTEVIETHLGDRLKNAVPTGKMKGHPIVYADAVGPVTTPGAIFIGEAARLVHGATGEGIAYAMRSGRLAAQVLSEHDRPNTDCLRTYQTRISHKFCWPLKTAVGFLRFVETPGFDLASRFLLNRQVQRGMRYALAHS